MDTVLIGCSLDSHKWIQFERPSRVFAFDCKLYTTI